VIYLGMVYASILQVEIYGMKRPTLGLLAAILLSVSLNASAGPCNRKMIYCTEGSFCEGCGAGHSFTAGTNVFGDFSIDLANSIEQLNKLAVIDPAHAIFTMQFAEGLRPDRQVDRYVHAYLLGTPTFGFYEMVLAAVMSGAQESDSLRDAANALTTPLEKGVIRAEAWLADSADNKVTLRVRTAIVDTPSPSPPTLEEARSVEKAFEIRELLNETLITLSEVDGLESVYVISRVMAD
jgi:hypothetical protein